LSVIGICSNISNTKFLCTCSQDWTGIHCETKINYCANITCKNNGVCRSLSNNYQCECLTSSYSGRYCEITATGLITRQTISKSFAYIVIIFLISVLVFVITLDVLKYGFHIDPAEDIQRRKWRKGIQKKQKKPPPVIKRFKYVNKPSAPPESSVDIVNETAV
jgi:hypothetical protein